MADPRRQRPCQSAGVYFGGNDGRNHHKDQRCLKRLYLGRSCYGLHHRRGAVSGGAHRRAEFLLGSKILLPFNIAYCLVAIVGATTDLGLIWAVSDTFNGFMTVPNLIAVFLLTPVVLKLIKAHFQKPLAPNHTDRL